MTRPALVMLIRHAEKPAGRCAGVAADGRADAEDLTVRGWQRAGALVRLLAPADGLPGTGLATPDCLHASRPSAAHPSHRTGSTLAPLAERIGVPLTCRYAVGEEAALAHEVLSLDGRIVLIAWEHHAAPSLMARLAHPVQTPTVWPDDCYDVTWVVAWQRGTATFKQRPQCLLDGDRLEPIASTLRAD